MIDTNKEKMKELNEEADAAMKKFIQSSARLNRLLGLPYPKTVDITHKATPASRDYDKKATREVLEKMKAVVRKYNDLIRESEYLVRESKPKTTSKLYIIFCVTL